MLVDFIHSAEQLARLELRFVTVGAIFHLCRDFLSLDSLAEGSVVLWNQGASRVEKVTHLFVETVLVDV